MAMRTKPGKGMMVGELAGLGEVIPQIAGMNDRQLLGLFARVLKAARVKSYRAPSILRIGRTAYYEVLRTPLPFDPPEGPEETGRKAKNGKMKLVLPIELAGVLPNLVGLADEQLLRLFARTLRTANIPPKRAGHILGISPATFNAWSRAPLHLDPPRRRSA